MHQCNAGRLEVVPLLERGSGLWHAGGVGFSREVSEDIEHTFLHSIRFHNCLFIVFINLGKTFGSNINFGSNISLRSSVSLASSIHVYCKESALDHTFVLNLRFTIFHLLLYCHIRVFSCWIDLGSELLGHFLSRVVAKNEISMGVTDSAFRAHATCEQAVDAFVIFRCFTSVSTLHMASHTGHS
ncbi:hypothetical protein K450DRAFT_135701 [Umbelopsis ramanniana AG]|uniref:Uncharacterized protein n=1 Tax=Umbelopsis ramanniana AG TaxID=1314678 RepID=A0AAD5H8I2_UMBRA|nr:uncharacterized protein K450DRAFT_135701 [Umbelopsis ramanniana AG]KAI8575805.1 hypothetical protein K450DRAFT_135701 [Umbelopsis ramanniana AG]